RSPKPAAAQSDQDQGTLPQPGGRQEAHLPRHRQRRAGVDADAQVDDSPARVQDPLRRPTPPATCTGSQPAYTENRTPSVETAIGRRKVTGPTYLTPPGAAAPTGHGVRSVVIWRETWSEGAPLDTRPGW